MFVRRAFAFEDHYIATFIAKKRSDVFFIQDALLGKFHPKHRSFFFSTRFVFTSVYIIHVFSLLGVSRSHHPGKILFHFNVTLQR